jgi:4-hydroxy-tetrahydrodipicolinate reductase
MNKVKLAILGCSGRTGSKILYHAIHDERIKLVGGMVSKTSRFLNDDLSKIISHDKKIGIAATSDLNIAIRDADMIIDFSTTDITSEFIRNANKLLKNKKLIIGVTGFDKSFHLELKNASKDHFIFHASNFSLGLALICEFLEKYSRILNDEYEIVINDIHHKHKKDAPSGTALMLKNSLESEGNGNNIQINSSRISEVLGIHELLMIDACESISIKHEVSDRSIFAINSLKIAHWFHNVKQYGLYHLKDFLDLGSDVK